METNDLSIPPSRVLLTHDRPEDFKLLKKRLKECGLELVYVHHHEEMEARLDSEEFALHIFDVRIYKEGIYGGRANPKGDLMVDGGALIRILCDKNGDRYLYEGEEDEGGELVFKSIDMENFIRKVRGLIEVDRYKKELRALSQELKSTQKALESSQAEMDEFTAIASHDLQEPLRKIKTFASRLESTGETFSPDQQDYLKRLCTSSERMQEYINNLSTYSRVDRHGHAFQRVDLNVILDECLRALRTRIQSSNAIIEKSVLPVLNGDPGQIQMVFMNLLDNSLKFVGQEMKPQISISSLKAGENFWQISFEDQGIGIPSDSFKRIFQPFERLHGRSQFGGAGMGLAICRKIARRHQGSLEVNSKLGEGSCFVLTLPAVKVDS